jgi:hypothetical protein
MSEPIIGASFKLFAQKLPGRYYGFYASERHFITSGPEPVLPMKVTVLAASEAVETDYWGWWKAEGDYVCLIYPRESLLEMCFPYGSKAETERGRGWVVRVRVEEVQT